MFNMDCLNMYSKILSCFADVWTVSALKFRRTYLNNLWSDDCINLLPSYIEVNLSICFISMRSGFMNSQGVLCWAQFITQITMVSSSSGVLRFKVVFDSLFSCCCVMTLNTAPHIASIRQIIKHTFTYKSLFSKAMFSILVGSQSISSSTWFSTNITIVSRGFNMRWFNMLKYVGFHFWQSSTKAALPLSISSSLHFWANKIIQIYSRKRSNLIQASDKGIHWKC